SLGRRAVDCEDGIRQPACARSLRRLCRHQLGLERDAMLLGEDGCKGRRRDQPALDEDLTEWSFRMLALLGERPLKADRGDDDLLHEEQPDRPPHAVRLLLVAPARARPAPPQYYPTLPG